MWGDLQQAARQSTDAQASETLATGRLALQGIAPRRDFHTVSSMEVRACQGVTTITKLFQGTSSRAVWEEKDAPTGRLPTGWEQRHLVARANLLVANNARADGQVFNVGTGQAAEIGDLARLLAARLGTPIEPLIPGEFRPGEMRALISDASRLAALGFAPRVGLAEGIDRYLDWVRAQGPIAEYFGNAERALRRRKVVKRATV